MCLKKQINPGLMLVNTLANSVVTVDIHTAQ